MDNGQRYLGDWPSWDGKPCKECGKQHPSWAHNPVTPFAAAKLAMVNQTGRTIYVLSNPDKYDEERREYSIALMHQRIAEFDLAAANREVNRTEKAERTRIKRRLKAEVERSVKRGDMDAARRLHKLLIEIRSSESELRHIEGNVR